MSSPPTPIALTIAGSDPSGGAGLQADLKTFHQHRVFGTAVVTLLTVQNTRGVQRVEVCSPELVIEQLNAVLEDLPPNAAKTGALGNAAVLEAVAERARHFSFPLVVDPVMVSKHGAPLMDEAAVDVARRRLLPCAFLLTPNLPEARTLLGEDPQDPAEDEAEMERIARSLAAMGAQNVLVKGGHRRGRATDLLWSSGTSRILVAERIETRNTHGTGCVTAAAITAQLASGRSLDEAVQRAKKFVLGAIAHNPGLGHGTGPIDLFQPAG